MYQNVHKKHAFHSKVKDLKSSFNQHFWSVCSRVERFLLSNSWTFDVKKWEKCFKNFREQNFPINLVYLKKSCAILIFGTFLKMLNNLTQTCLCATFLHGTIILFMQNTSISPSDIFSEFANTYVFKRVKN